MTERKEPIVNRARASIPLRRTALVLFVAAFLTVGLLFRWWLSGLDVVDIDESFLEQCPELAPFIDCRIGFKGIGHNVDTARVQFEIMVPHETAADYFRFVHSKAIADGWTETTSSPLQRVYEIPGWYRPTDGDLVRVVLTYYPLVHRVRLTKERVYL
jgi:hypothetical protein